MAPIAILAIVMAALWLISAVFSYFFVGEHEIVKRSAKEREIVKQINAMEWVKRVMPQSIKYSFYQTSYILGKQGGFADLKNVISYKNIPYWRTYETTQFNDAKLKENLDKTFVGYLNEYADSLGIVGIDTEQFQTAPPVPRVVYPNDKLSIPENIPINPTLEWTNTVEFNGWYQLYYKKTSDKDFTAIIKDNVPEKIYTTSYKLSGLSTSTDYEWKVIAFNSENKYKDSTTWKFKTAAAPPSDFDFVITISPIPVTVVQSSSIDITVKATLTSLGKSKPVSFSVSGLPDGASVNFNPISCDPTCSSIMRITTTNAIKLKSDGYTITIAVSGGELTRDGQFTLNVEGAGTLQKPHLILPADGEYVSVTPTLEWSSPEGASWYGLYYKKSTESEWKIPVPSGIDTNSYTLSGLSPGTTYEWNVRACKGSVTALECKDSPETWEFVTSKPPAYTEISYTKETGDTTVTIKTKDKLELKSGEVVVQDSANFSEKIDIRTLELFDIGKKNFVDKDPINTAIIDGINSFGNSRISGYDNNKQASDGSLKKCGSCPTGEEVFSAKNGMSFDQAKDLIKAEIQKKIKELENSLNKGSLNEYGFNLKLEPSEIKADIKPVLISCEQGECCAGCEGGCCAWWWTATYKFYYYGSARVLVEITDTSKQYPVYDYGEKNTNLRNIQLDFYSLSGKHEIDICIRI